MKEQLGKHVVKPIITYDAIVWWPKITQKPAGLEHTDIQRIACL